MNTALRALRRHRLACLSGDAWAGVLARPWDDPARACLAHWAEQGLPLVITRQPAAAEGPAAIALGLPAPLCWGRRRLAIQVPCEALLYFDEFPDARAAARLMPPVARPAWLALADALDAAQATARVYGSYGWQLMSGLGYLTRQSDVDLWIGVDDAQHADAVAQRLMAFAAAQPLGLDGELVFADGAAVAWREWHAWRGGRTRQVLVKRLHGASLEAALPAAWHGLGLELAA